MRVLHRSGLTGESLSTWETSKGPQALWGPCFGRRNMANPRTGSGMQQARRALVEQAVEVVGNHEDGT